MKLISEKYRKLSPLREYIGDEVVMAQAWKKSHGYVRAFNWYADTLALDISALGVEENVHLWSDQLIRGASLHPLELVPAAKSEAWRIHPKKGWLPKDKTSRDTDPPLRPLAHITIRDQTWATAAMLCLADAVETEQGDCSGTGSFRDAQARGVYSYGNRLVCDWQKDGAWFRWGNSDIYRKFFIDYQNFLKRPIEIGREVVDVHADSDQVYVISLDLKKFYDKINRPLLIERLSRICDQFNRPMDDGFREAFSRVIDWRWASTSRQRAEALNLSLGEGLPQGLVASGFFANAYMTGFDRAVGEVIGRELKGSDVVLHDYCRYVDDIRLVISSEESDTFDIELKINHWIGSMLREHAGADLSLNDSKTKVTLLTDLDNRASMAGRIEMIQSELSGPADRDVLDGAVGILESLLSTDADENQDFSNFEDSSEIAFMQIAQFDHDIRSDTLKRFAANRLETIMRSKRLISAGRSHPNSGETMVESDNESELLAKKLVFAWMKDPSLGLVLRKAIEIYPSADLFEPVFEAIYRRSSFPGAEEGDVVTQAVMNYLLADIFRCGVDFHGFFQSVVFPSTVAPQEILELLVRYAQRCISGGTESEYVGRQALMLLAVMNRPNLMDSDYSTIQRDLHSILAGRLPEYHIQRAALFEVAGQITGSNDTYASLLLQYISDQSEDDQYEVLKILAKRGGPFWLALWNRVRKREKLSFLKEALAWAAPILPSRPKPIKQRLAKVIASELNGFEHEAGLIKLGLGLVKLVEVTSAPCFVSPKHIKVVMDVGESWARVWHPSVKKVTCEIDSSNKQVDPRYCVPEWIAGTDERLTMNHRAIYWIGTILRAAAVGGADFTGNRWKTGRSITYKGLRTSWYKRRMGMMHAPEAIVGDFATVTAWTSELLTRCLQWPGFESTFVRHEDVKRIADLHSLKECLEDRLRYLNSMFCSGSDIPALVTEVRRPNNSNELFRLVTVQTLLPRSCDFSPSDVTLSGNRVRAKHREHLMSVCQITLKTLEAKLRADGDTGKPGADLIVFPELSVHIDDQDILKRLADKTRSMIFAGLVFIDRDGRYVNIARWFIPDYKDSGRQWVIRDQGKFSMTADEDALGVTGYRPCQHIIEVVGHPEGPFRLSGAICYDATDIRLAADLKDITDLFVVTAHNKDVNTFDSMAAALQYHMFQHVVIANKGEFGGSTIQAPFKQPFHRLISHTHGSDQVSIHTADLDLAAFTRKVRSYKEVKTKPAGLKR